MAGLKGYACLTCRQRKVKCDQLEPCHNCTKAKGQCKYVEPSRQKRRRTKPIKESLHAKLERYERLLKSYGAKLELSDGSDSDSETEVADPKDDLKRLKRDLSGTTDVFGLDDNKPMLISQCGSSRYVDSGVWPRLSQTFEQANLDDPDTVMNDPKLFEEDGLLLESCSQVEDLSKLHPPRQIVSKLKEAFVNGVDPLIKILHLPTFWTTLDATIEQPRTVPKETEALVFSFYLTVVGMFEESDCRRYFETSKSTVQTRFRIAARNALIKAGYLSTSNLTTLQAFSLFLVGVSSTYQFDTLFMLSGVAIRIGRKMGLHRDGTKLGVPPFETEMRRRIWWHLVFADFKMADVLSTRPSLDLFFSCDVKKPLNVPDEDLNPRMNEFPQERKGITTVMVCLIRCELIDVLRKFSAPLSTDLRWESLGDSHISMQEKDAIVKDAEELFEDKFLRYYDPFEPLHHLASIIIRTSLCKMKLFAHNPKKYSEYEEVPQVERDYVLENASKLLQYATLLPGNPHLSKFQWQVSLSYLWNTILFVLIEARHRKTGPEVDAIWELIGKVVTHYPSFFANAKGALYASMRKWTTEVWDKYVVATNDAGRPILPTPEYIEEMRRELKAPSETRADPPRQTELPPMTCNSNFQTGFMAQAQDPGYGHGYDFLPSSDFSNIMNFETDPNAWLYWEQLLNEQGGTAEMSNC